MFMSKSANTKDILPSQVDKALLKFGADLRIARERRSESLRAWASRMGVSVPTLRRMEAGDASVGISVYATALWLAGLIGNLSASADPAKDEYALSLDIQRAGARRRKF